MTATDGRVPSGAPVSSPSGSRAVHAENPLSDKSLGELVSTATRDLSTLIRSEVQLAKVELKQEAVTAGKGAGMLGGAGLFGLFALLFFSIGAAFGFAWLGVPLGWGFVIVGAFYLLAAAVLALIGVKNLKRVNPPEKTIETVKDDIAWAKHPTTPPAPVAPSRVTVAQVPGSDPVGGSTAQGSTAQR